MTPLSSVTEQGLSFVKKIFTFDDGLLPMVSSIPAYLSVLLIQQMPTSAEVQVIDETLKILFSDISARDIYLSFVIGIVSIFMYFIIFSIDFITGVKAAKFEAHGEKGWFKSDKGWSSFWKLFIISVLIFILIIFSIVFLIIGGSAVHALLLWIMTLISISACLLDFISIGENHERRFNKKPQIYLLVEKMYDAIQNNIIKKIGNI